MQKTQLNLFSQVYEIDRQTIILKTNHCHMKKTKVSNKLHKLKIV